MRKKQKFYQVFSLCVLTALMIIIISPLGLVQSISSVIENLTSPIQKSIYTNLGISFTNNKTELDKFKSDNLDLNVRLVKMSLLEKDLEALNSQFSVSEIPVINLLRAEIIGSNMELPGLPPTEIIINRGSDQGIMTGQAVIFKDNLIGVTNKVTKSRTSVSLLNNEKSSLPANSLTTNALGVLKGTGNGLNFENVLLSDELNENDLVLTKGDVKLNGSGIKPGLIIGKIGTIDKKPSALFQSAMVTQLVDVTKLTTVFIIIE